MYIFNLTYKKPLEEVERFLAEHIAYLEKYYTKKLFICSGRKEPRSGGVILCNAKNLQEAQQILQEDPFYQQEIATYEVIDFTPSKYAKGFEKFVNNLV